MEEQNSFPLDELELVALRGIEARRQLLVKEVETVTRDIDADRAVLYGSIEARLDLEAGAIATGKYVVQNGQLIKGETA